MCVFIVTRRTLAIGLPQNGRFLVYPSRMIPATGCAIFSLPLGLVMCIHMVAQHHINTEAKLGDIAEIHGIRRVAFAQHGVAMLVEGHCRKALGQSVGNHSLSGAWEELDHLGGDGLANPVPASVDVPGGLAIDRIFSHANDSTRIFIEFGWSTLL